MFPLVRSRGAGWCTIYLPDGGTAAAEGRRAGEAAAAAGGESQTRDGASPSSLPAAGRGERGALRHRALHAAAATAGGHRHSDTVQVMTHDHKFLMFLHVEYICMYSDLGDVNVQQTCPLLTYNDCGKRT